jgi:hypothetical protein
VAKFLPERLRKALLRQFLTGIADGSITNPKISSGLDGTKLTDGSVGDAKIAAPLDPAKVDGEALTKATTFAGDVGGPWDALALGTARWKIKNGQPSAADEIGVFQSGGLWYLGIKRSGVIRAVELNVAF